jgi:Ca-activated chloride channel homolog
MTWLSDSSLRRIRQSIDKTQVERWLHSGAAMRTTKLLPLILITLAACTGGSDSAMFNGTESSANGGSNTPLGPGEAPEAQMSAGAGQAVVGDAVGQTVENDWVDTATAATSTFGIDVDTGSYTLTRGLLDQGTLPTAVRTEEFINYFHYDYAPPIDGKPFSVVLDGAPSKFGDGYHLVRVGLQGIPVDLSQRKQANIVFLVDVSGSMDEPTKLPLVKETLRRLLDKLVSTDRLAIVTYAGYESVLLAPTAVVDKPSILSAIDGLSAGGGTNGEGGILKAYGLADGMKPANGGAVTRVILCTDGDFNVGATGDALVQLIEKERDGGVTLTTLGFGDGSAGMYNDAEMEALADHGNGNYDFIDSADELDRLIDKRFVSMLQVIAKDAKIEVDFLPDAVSKYRLIGYENRVMSKADFDDDKKDSGDLGAGHSVTALYEVALTDAAKQGAIDLANVHLRYKKPDGDVSTTIDTTLPGSALAASFDAAPTSLRFAAATAEFAEILRRSKFSEGARFDDVATVANAAAGGDADKSELVGLVAKAKAIWH